MARLVFDIGGTNLKYATYDNGKLIGASECPSRAAEGAEVLIENLIKIIKENMSPEIDSIGISTAGQVDSKKGVIAFANQNIPNYTGYKLGEKISEMFDLPCFVENDVNCAGLGELTNNKALDGDFVFVAYGTGIGGAIIIDKKALIGSNFFAAGIGQMRLFDEESSSYCEYEDLASTKQLVKNLKAINPDIENGRMIFSHLDDERIVKAIDDWVYKIVIGLINVTYLIDPKYIVLGGGIMENDYVFTKVKEKYQEVKNPFLKTKLVQASSGNKAGLLGAATLK